MKEPGEDTEGFAASLENNVEGKQSDMQLGNGLEGQNGCGSCQETHVYRQEMLETQTIVLVVVAA